MKEFEFPNDHLGRLCRKIIAELLKDGKEYKTALSTLRDKFQHKAQKKPLTQPAEFKQEAYFSHPPETRNLLSFDFGYVSFKVRLHRLSYEVHNHLKDQEFFLEYNRMPRKNFGAYSFAETKESIKSRPIQSQVHIWKVELIEIKEFCKEDIQLYCNQHIAKVENEILRLQALSQSEDQLPAQSPKPLIWKGKINELATAFYNLKEDGHIDCSREGLKNWIVDNFLDKKGQKIKEKTIETLLRPERDWQRSNNPQLATPNMITEREQDQD